MHLNMKKSENLGHSSKFMPNDFNRQFEVYSSKTADQNISIQHVKSADAVQISKRKYQSNPVKKCFKNQYNSNPTPQPLQDSKILL